MKKCESLKNKLDFEVEFAYPTFSKNNISIPWLGSISRHSTSVKAIFHPIFEQLVQNLPFLEEGMVIITDTHYKIKSEKFSVKTVGLEYGSCEIQRTNNKQIVMFTPIVEGESTLEIELISV